MDGIRVTLCQRPTPHELMHSMLVGAYLQNAIIYIHSDALIYAWRLVRLLKVGRRLPQI